MRNYSRKGGLLNKLTPAQILVLGFAAVILMGGLLLTLPIASTSGQATSFVDALFTSTSAVCVTGLVVVDTGTHWTVFGQVVIMLLIQVGGLGFMTVGTLFAMLLGKRINLKSRILIQEALNNLRIEGIVRLVRYVLMVTFTVEGTAALILAVRWSFDMPWKKALYFGIFHAVSGFNNAGFDLFGDFRSITGYVDDITVNLVIAGLIIIGGIGFVVIADTIQHRNWRNFSLHTKMVLTTTAFMIIGGTAAIFALEYTNPQTMAPLTMKGKVLSAYFQSVTPRTAGFNTLSISGLRSATQFLIVILMFIGASPGSTGGGIKTATFMTLVIAFWAVVRGHEDVQVFKRRIPKEIVDRSLIIFMAALGLVSAVTMFLAITEKADFLTILFETTSAFGTVGLSMGLTPSLTVIGRLLITLTMFAGRVGPLTIAFAVAQRHHKDSFKSAQEKIMVG
ncbi:MAG: TrkH family potassium uptake protein [Firmicutes bacterium]|nr:TrkH family potassium uptake protein [Bacillota bacterium]